MKGKKRLTINIIAQMVSFMVSMGINFLLTPFIVGKLGTDAYGFIGLSNNFISYAQIVTIALNSMAGRFIAIEYLKGNVLASKKYYTSVFYANIFLALIVSFLAIACTLYLEYMINIPDGLLSDVKLLFTMLVGNFVASLVFSVYGVATFIKNRLDYSAILSVFSNLLKAILLTVAFAFLTPMLWYVGCATIICTLFVGLFNYHFKLFLTPELRTSASLYDNRFVFTIVKSGIWNSVSRLSNVIEQGFDLLFANLFIGATAMGQLSITKQIPVIILAFVGTIGSSFAPSLTESFARNDKDNMKSEIMVSVKIIGFFAIIPLCFIFSFADSFYSIWLPGQDSSELYILTIIGVVFFPILLSLQGLQNLWPVIDKVKSYSLASIVFSSLTFITVLSGISFIQESFRIYYLASVSSFYNILFTIFFIPLYASYCLGVKKGFFYPIILKILLSVTIVVALLLVLKSYYTIDGWGELLVALSVDVLLCVLVGSFCVLNKNDRQILLNKVSSLSQRMGKI